jgi:ketosteroid isomerase-like protein
MSQENVDAMRRAIEIWNRDDFDAYLQMVEELVHPDLEWFAVIAQLVEGQDTVYRGITGMRRFWEDWHEVFDFRFDQTDIREVGGKVVVLSHATVTGRGSGVNLDTPIAMVLTFEGKRLIRSLSYLDHAEALEAAGLED